MSLPEGYLPRKGDELLIRARVKYDTEPGDNCYVNVVGQEYINLFLPLAYIYALHCRRWSEGDKVTSLEFDGHGTVLATSDDWVWVMCETGDDNGGRYTLPANDLEPYVEPGKDMVAVGEEIALSYPAAPQAPCGGKIGSQSLVGDDDPIF